MDFDILCDTVSWSCGNDQKLGGADVSGRQNEDIFLHFIQELNVRLMLTFECLYVYQQCKDFNFLFLF